MTAWPDSLPLPRVDGAGRQQGKGAGRFETDAGPADQFTTTTAVFEVLTLIYRCTAAQRDTLTDFFRGPAGMGGVWFDYTNPFTKRAGQARFFSGQEPKETAVPPKFAMAVTLEFRG